ncbi:MAG: 2-C-methyl-D-erythritol 2,4-cyclodiphosphate synthase, partial [Opitutaceae bacterium]|nr:2-C-methyl-D-erythritol 2,4-cyclodiphosphate synthase [Opitutaceae bacterium]
MFRIGHGYDIHRANPARPLVLGGVPFPDAPFGLDGHSDADCLTHAICDALLGALALPDIGHFFPNT